MFLKEHISTLTFDPPQLPQYSKKTNGEKRKQFSICKYWPLSKIGQNHLVFFVKKRAIKIFVFINSSRFVKAMSAAAAQQISQGKRTMWMVTFQNQNCCTHRGREDKKRRDPRDRGIYIIFTENAQRGNEHFVTYQDLRK